MPKKYPAGNPGGVMPPNVGVKPGNPRDQFAPYPGTRYNPPAAETAVNRVDSWPTSKSPGGTDHSPETNQISSRRPAQRGPFQSDSDNAHAKELLKPYYPNGKPDLMR